MKIKSLLQKVTLPIKRQSRKLLRYFYTQNYEHSHDFAMLCVKRPVYVDLIINNVNSLHYLNPTHTITIHCDDICAPHLEKALNKFDYPKQISIQNIFGDGSQTWQHYKVEHILKASEEDKVHLDADGIWHDDPILDREKITFLVSPQTIGEKKLIKDVILNVFGNEEWLDFRYHTAAFVSMPSHFVTPGLKDLCRAFLEPLMYETFDFLETQEERDEARRLAEQTAINLGVLITHSEENVTDLKDHDGPKNKHLLQSLYYGTAKRIIE